MSAIRVRAPATTANLGPGFDCAAVALELWNELEVGEGDAHGRSPITSACAPSRCVAPVAGLDVPLDGAASRAAGGSGRARP